MADDHSFEIEPRTFIEVGDPPIFTASNGKLWRRGVYLDREMAERLIPLFEERADMRDLAEQLRSAIRELAR